MNKKCLFVIGIILIILIVMATIFGIIDLKKIKNSQKPIFSFKYKTYESEVSTEYIGIGYKIFNYVKSENQPYISTVKIGTLFMRYNNPYTVDNNETVNTFIGTVIEKSNNIIIIEPKLTEEIRKSSDKISVSIDNEISNNIELGAIVKVKYRGYLKETYPVQIDLVDINVLEMDKVALMYETAIDNIITLDPGLNGKAQYISIDTDSFVRPLSKDEKTIKSSYPAIDSTTKNVLLNYSKKYNFEVKNYSFEKLNENGLCSEKNNYIDGILIYVSEVEKISDDEAIFTMTKYRSGDAAIFPKYKLSYIENKWKIELISMAIS